jgi:gamma-glutamyl-gamma-aminobutyrate hydrolase PuuD
MKRLGITQRVQNVHHYAERRDCLDQRWASMALQLGYLPLPLPNLATDQVPMLLDNLQLDGVLLSGGNSIASLEPESEDTAPERDRFEAALLEQAIERKLPLIGVCRGMQLINFELGGRLSPISGHVAERHSLTQQGSVQFPDEVNSYHNWAIPRDGLAAELTPLAFDSEGNVEAFECPEKKLLGIMWHPEREQPFRNLDVKLIKRYLS